MDVYEVYLIVVFILGLVIGSFLNVCIYRIPLGESIVAPPSHCKACGTRLKPYDLIPVLSWIFLKGRCRYCGEKISARYMLVELLTGFVFVLLFYKYSLTVDFLASAFIMSILIAVFFIDMDHGIIPDGLVLAGLAGGILLILYNFFQPVEIFRDRSWWNPVLGIFTGSGILFLIAVIGMIVYKTDNVMGMGDVKIFAPIGAFLGWRMCLMALIVAIFLAGLTSLLLVVLKIKERKSTIPFGPFIVTGTFITIMWGRDILNWYLYVI